MHLYDGGNNGLTVAYAHNIIFYNNRVDQIGHDALYAVETLYVEAYNNAVTCRTNSAFRANNTNHVKIHDNIIDSAIGGGPGIQIQKTDPPSTTATDYPMDDIEICNNVIHDTYGSGIWLIASSARYQSDPDEYGTGRALTKDDVKDVHIHHNIFYGNGTHPSINGVAGILTAGFNDTIIENNVFDGCRNAAVCIMAGGNPTGTAFTYADSDSGHVTIVRNNIIVNSVKRTWNASTSGWGVSNTLPFTHSLLFQNNCLYNNIQGDYNNTTAGEDDFHAHPLFADSTNHDYHLKSWYGRWDGTTWVTDSVTSPCIDAGCGTSSWANEPAPNGRRIKVGRYGNTTEASKSSSDITSVDETPPTLFQLGQNTPNPFNPSTSITYSVPTASMVKISIYTVAGQKVATLVNGKQAAGVHTVRWKPEYLASGIFFCRMEAGNFTGTMRLVYMK